MNQKKENLNASYLFQSVLVRRHAYASYPDNSILKEETSSSPISITWIRAYQRCTLDSGYIHRYILLKARIPGICCGFFLPPPFLFALYMQCIDILDGTEFIRNYR